MTFDAIVIGAGHNGLTCAAYLGRAGLRVLVLEARELVGGMSSTVELAPGVRAPALAHTVGRLSPTVARELGLRRHGLRLAESDARTFAPQLDGRAITLWGDADRTAQELAQNSLVGKADADRYAKADAQLRLLGRSLAPILRRAPADLAATSLGATVRSVAGAALLDAQLLRYMPMAVRDLVEEWFESDALRAAIAVRGVLYTALGPRMPGTAGVLINDAASGGGLGGQAVIARGGPGAVSDAMAEAIKEKGGEIRTGARVTCVRRKGERVVGVTLASGDEIDAPVVVSGLDPQTSLLDLLEPEVVGPRLSWRASNIRQSGATAKVNYALRALPVFPAAFDDARRLRGRIVVAPSMHYLELAARPVRHAQVADQPLLEITIPSLVDPTLVEVDRAGAAHHVMSVVAQSFPRELGQGTWDERRDELGDIVNATIEEYAPGFTELIVRRVVTTPLDIERDFGARGGHPMHAEVALDQWFEWRPLHGLGRYRMPLEGYYMCGSGTHPGGGVTGSPGRLAAHEVVRDVQAGRFKTAA